MCNILWKTFYRRLTLNRFKWSKNFLNMTNIVWLDFTGAEFMMPVNAFYCRLCREFSGDGFCASEHLKSVKHNIKHQVGKYFLYQWNQGWLVHKIDGDWYCYSERNESKSICSKFHIAPTSHSGTHYLPCKCVLFSVQPASQPANNLILVKCCWARDILACILESGLTLVLD